jgi:hypothetical protein
MGRCVRARVAPRYDLTDQAPDPQLVGESVRAIFRANEAPATAGPESGYTTDYINDMLISGTLVARRRNGGDCLGNQCYFKCPTVVALQGIIANIAPGLNQIRLAH